MHIPKLINIENREAGIVFKMDVNYYHHKLDALDFFGFEIFDTGDGYIGALLDLSSMVPERLWRMVSAESQEGREAFEIELNRIFEPVYMSFLGNNINPIHN